MSKLVPIFGLVFPVCLAVAQQRPCTGAEAQRAEMTADTLHSWEALYEWYKLYGQCGEGGGGEGYAESVARILVDHWTTLPRFADLAKKDSRFQRFVVAHIGTTLDINDWTGLNAWPCFICCMYTPGPYAGCPGVADPSSQAFPSL